MENHEFIDLHASAQALQFLGLEGQSKWAFLCYESLFFCFFFACAWAAVHFIRWDRR